MKVTTTQLSPGRVPLALPGFIALSLLLLLLPESGTEPLRAGVRGMLQPLLQLASRAPAGPQQMPASIGMRINADNTQNAATPASDPRAELDHANAEIIRLRELLRRQAGEMLPADAQRREVPGLNADVIARRTLWQEPVLGLNKGSAEGVRPEAGVMHRGAVIGRIVACGAHSSSMALLTHRGMSIGARLADSRLEGVLRGARTADDAVHLCSLLIVARELKARVGEQVLTSGLDGCFPAGLWLGTVTAIRQNPDYQWELSVQPARAETSIEAVRVLTLPPLDVPWPLLPEKK